MTCCDRREAWPQARRERRSGLDLATEESLTPAMRGDDRGRGERTREARFAGSNPHSGFNGVARHRARYGRRRLGVVTGRPLPDIRVSTESQDIVRDTAEGVSEW